MALKHRLGEASRWVTARCFFFACWLIATFLPVRFWYGAALWLARALARTVGKLAPSAQGASEASLVPRLLHRFLDLLSNRRTHFPIPLVIQGEEHLRDYAAQPGGFVCCSAHIPFVKLFLPLVRRTLGQQRAMRVIAREPVGDNEVSAWNDEHWKAIRTDHAVLLHTRSLLRQNGVLLLAVDKEQGEFISSNIFRFVGKMHSRILMWFTQLQPDGKILLRILLPPGPGCRSEEEIRANLDFVAENVRLILRGDTMAPAARIRIAADVGHETRYAREIHRIQLYSDPQLEARVKRLETLLRQQNGNLSKREQLEDRLALMHSELEVRAGA